MAAIGDTSHVILCQGTSGTGSSITYDNTKIWQYVKAKTPEIAITFESKTKSLAYHKSRTSPDVKYKQEYKVSGGKFKAADVNSITEWLTAAYIAKTAIYLLVDYPSSGSYAKKSWYDDTNTKVYYLKGTLKSLQIKQKAGGIWDISFQFVESWA